VLTAKSVIALERAQSFKTCNPSFVVVMRASYVEHRFLMVSCKQSLVARTKYAPTKDN